jgi:hypothetical protein
LLQGGKWDQAKEVFKRMLTGKDAARANAVTLNYLLQFQVELIYIIYFE